MINAMRIDPRDNVAVAVETINAGDEIVWPDAEGLLSHLTAETDVHIYHKFALRDITQGEKIVKYGEHIGEAGCDIKAGSEVHVHNVVSVREDLK